MKQEPAHRKLTVYTYSDGKRHLIPEIRLRGQWLKQAGFAQGAPIEVVVHPCRLTVIRKDADESK